MNSKVTQSLPAAASSPAPSKYIAAGRVVRWSVARQKEKRCISNRLIGSTFPLRFHNLKSLLGMYDHLLQTLNIMVTLMLCDILCEFQEGPSFKIFVSETELVF